MNITWCPPMQNIMTRDVSAIICHIAMGFCGGCPWPSARSTLCQNVVTSVWTGFLAFRVSPVGTKSGGLGSPPNLSGSRWCPGSFTCFRASAQLLSRSYPSWRIEPTLGHPFRVLFRQPFELLLLLRRHHVSICLRRRIARSSISSSATPLNKIARRRSPRFRHSRSRILQTLL